MIKRTNAIILFIYFSLLIVGCKEHENSCKYTLNTLLKIDTPRMAFSKRNDTLIECKDTSDYFGLYNFDKNRTLRYYSFFFDDMSLKYSEEYDKNGEVVLRHGNPLLYYEIRKGKKDTVVFDGYLFGFIYPRHNFFYVTENGWWRHQPF